MTPLTPEQASALVTIVVVPRERFNVAVVSLDSLLKETAPGYELIYVDGGSPPFVQEPLRQRAERHGFTLIREQRFLAPPVAHNIGLRRAHRKYVVFLDNDTLFRPDWLTPLVNCAEETGAGLVGPLYMAGPFELEKVHMQGGLWRVEHKNGQDWPSDDYVLTELSLREAEGQLRRRPVDFLEFHCMLARADLLKKIGPCDERLLSSADHIDIALLARQHGAVAISEPSSVMTYLRPFEMELYDLSFFLVRWSPEWNRSTLAAFAAKWNLARASPFITWQSRWLDENGAAFGLIKAPAEVAERIVPPHSAAIAQTNMALYGLMAGEGYTTEEIGAVGQAYALAQQLFGHLYRNSGKPFLAHAVGTASVLATYRQPVDALRAALLHAAFTHARYPADVGANDRTAWLERHLGDKVVRLIAHYHHWQGGAPPPQTAEAIMRRPAWEAAGFAIAMANAIEDATDGSLGYGHHEVESTRQWLDAYDLIARLIHLPGLAASVRLALQAPAPAWISAVAARAPISYSLRPRSGAVVALDAQGEDEP